MQLLYSCGFLTLNQGCIIQALPPLATSNFTVYTTRYVATVSTVKQLFHISQCSADASAKLYPGCVHIISSNDLSGGVATGTSEPAVQTQSMIHVLACYWYTIQQCRHIFFFFHFISVSLQACMSTYKTSLKKRALLSPSSYSSVIVVQQGEQ